MSIKVSIKVMKIPEMKQDEYEKECLSGNVYMGERNPVSSDEVQMKNNLEGMLTELKKIHKFKQPLETEEICKEIVYINPKKGKDDVKRVWMTGLDEKWIEFSFKNNITLKKGGVFEIRMY